MSNLSKPVLAQDEGRILSMAGSTHYKHHDSCCSPFFLSREIISTKAGKGIPTFYAKSFARPALQSIVLFLLVVVSLMAIVKPAHASGTVTVPSWQGFIGAAGQQQTLFYATSEIKIDAMIESAFPEAVAKGKQFLLDLYAMRGWNCPIRVERPATLGQSGASYFIEYKSSCSVQSMMVAQYTKTFIGGQLSCPDHSTGTTTCTCNDGYVPDPTATSCVPSTCPVDPLPPLPTDDACAQSLEKGAGEDVNKACPELTDEMKKQAQCVYDKIWKLSPPISYSKPSATIRNTAYQNHLVAVWNKLKEIKKKQLSDAQKQACAAVISHVGRHGIDSPPSQSGNEAPHVKGEAIDIPKGVAKAMMEQAATFITMPKPPGCLPCNDVITVIGDVQDYVNSATVNPPACNLRWGGRFTPIDRVHFQLP